MNQENYGTVLNSRGVFVLHTNSYELLSNFVEEGGVTFVHAQLYFS